jgi:hypothetical protein
MESKFTLEYNEQQGMFHLNNGSQPKNTNGYKTILEDLTLDQYQKFTDSIKGRKITYAFLIKEATKFKKKKR